MLLLTKISLLILFFMFALIISGATAMPAETGLHWLMQFKNGMPNFMANWLQQCYEALKDTNEKYPFLAYGYDWLAFAHFVIALSFVGVFKNPVKNIWIIEWQILCCILVFPLALIAGPIRQIPKFHIFIDCCFGILGIFPLMLCRKWIKRLEKNNFSN